MTIAKTANRAAQSREKISHRACRAGRITRSRASVVSSSRGDGDAPPTRTGAAWPVRMDFQYHPLPAGVRLGLITPWSL